MTKIETWIGAVSLAAVALFAMVLMPAKTHAEPSPHAYLGGGNALSRATSGESQGLAHATSTSDLLDHLTFASTHGGRAEQVPPTEDDDGADEPADDGSSDDQGDEGGFLPDNASENAQSHANGGSQSGNGGDGGEASNGGLVRAGSVVTNSHAVNVINTNIVRISNR